MAYPSYVTLPQSVLEAQADIVDRADCPATVATTASWSFDREISSPTATSRDLWTGTFVYQHGVLDERANWIQVGDITHRRWVNGVERTPDILAAGGAQLVCIVPETYGKPLGWWELFFRINGGAAYVTYPQLTDGYTYVPSDPFCFAADAATTISGSHSSCAGFGYVKTLDQHKRQTGSCALPNDWVQTRVETLSLVVNP